MGRPALIIAAVGIVIQCLFIITEHKEKYVGAVLLKGTASLAFILVGLFGYALTKETEIAQLILIGLLLGGVGDVLLNLRFVFKRAGQAIFLAGIAAFLAGHILYLLAIIPQSTSLIPCVIIGAVIAAAVLAYIFKTMEVKTSFKIFGVFYIGAVIIMTAVAIGNCISSPFESQLLYAIGAVLFTVSDIVLIFNTFSGTTKFSLRILNLTMYYFGQLLIALSVMYL